jgi:hypothetical protein
MSRNIILPLSAGEVNWDGAGDNVNLGPFSKDQIIFKSELSTVDIFQQGYGDTPYDSFTKGRVASLELTMREMTAARLELIQGCVQSTGPVFTFDSSCGVSLRDAAKEVIIKPMVNLVVSTTNTEWITIFLVSPPIDAFEIGYDDEGERLWKVMFKVFPSAATGTVGKLFKIGT